MSLEEYLEYIETALLSIYNYHINNIFSELTEYVDSKIEALDLRD